MQKRSQKDAIGFLAIGYLFMKRAKDVQVFNLIGRSLDSGHDTFKRLKPHSPELRETYK